VDHPLGEHAGGVDQVLAVVEDQEQSLGPEVLDDAVDGTDMMVTMGD
jgi:hypothetical protein